MLAKLPTQAASSLTVTFKPTLSLASNPGGGVVTVTVSPGIAVPAGTIYQVTAAFSNLALTQNSTTPNVTFTGLSACTNITFTAVVVVNGASSETSDPLVVQSPCSPPPLPPPSPFPPVRLKPWLLLLPLARGCWH